MTAEVCADDAALLESVSTPMTILEEAYTSLSNEQRIWDDRMQTYMIGTAFDEESEREFICLCTRCRECRHRKKDAAPASPRLVVRRYRSSVGEELFLSFEDRAGYVY